MKFYISKAIKVKKNFYEDIISDLEEYIPFNIELNEDESNKLLIIDDGMNNSVDLNIYLSDNVKGKELSKVLFDLIRYYYV